MTLSERMQYQAGRYSTIHNFNFIRYIFHFGLLNRCETMPSPMRLTSFNFVFTMSAVRSTWFPERIAQW